MVRAAECKLQRVFARNKLREGAILEAWWFGQLQA
jgi:hypothetical protein